MSRGIPFSDAMVRALLDGRKTQTRRLLSLRGYRGFTRFGPSETPGYDWTFRRADMAWCDMSHERLLQLLPYAEGDTLYVRESYYHWGHWEPVPGVKTKTGRMKWRFVGHEVMRTFQEPESYRKGRHHKDPQTPAWHKRLGRFMPRAYARLQLTVTNVRIERLQDISDAEARAEGVSHNAIPGCTKVPWGIVGISTLQSGFSTPLRAFSGLWNSLHAQPGERWEDNPWLMVVTFTVKRIDREERGQQ